MVQALDAAGAQDEEQATLQALGEERPEGGRGVDVEQARRVGLATARTQEAARARAERARVARRQEEEHRRAEVEEAREALRVVLEVATGAMTAEGDDRAGKGSTQ